MIAQISFRGAELWFVAGWMMLHFLWLGTAAGLAAMACRLLVRRASADVRYAVALASLAVLAALPMGIGAWLIGRAPVETSVAAELPQAGEINELHNRDAVPISASAPVFAGGFVAGDAAIPIAAPSDVVPVNPRQSRGLTAVFATMSEAWISYLPWLWLIGTPLTFALLSTGIVGAERLRQASTVIDDGPIAVACARLRQSLGISRYVAVAVCERIAAPILVGILRPIILLPPSALTGWSPDEIEMVLLHELAHVRRWDNLVNLAQRLVESLLFFHPAVWLVSGWVRGEREACCDAMVIHRTNRPHAYAEMLVALATQLSEPGRPRPRHDADRGRRRPGPLTVGGAMAAGPLRARIRRILQLEDDPMLVSGKSIAIVLGSLLIAGTLAGLYLPAVGRAEESNTQGSDGTESSPSGIDVEDTDNLERPTAAALTYSVQFEEGVSGFVDGDNIKVLEVRGTAQTFVPGNTYWIKGTYTLNSRDQAQLSAFITAKNATEGIGPVRKSQSIVVNRGQGTFELVLPMTVEGWPHISFYPANGGDDFGGTYFGSSDSVLKRSWNSNERPNQSATAIAAETSTNENPTVSLKQFNVTRLPADSSVEILIKTVDDLITSGVASDSQITLAFPPEWQMSSINRALDQMRQWKEAGRIQNSSIAFLPGGQLEILVQKPLAAPATNERTKDSKTPSKFPSLEDQKLADLAWKMLQLELEPINDEELKRVRAMGYDGGVKVVKSPMFRDGIWTNDILVGLHVWPTMSLKDVAGVLNRADLDELNPLKFYVVRLTETEAPHVVSGRISVGVPDRPSQSPPPAGTANESRFVDAIVETTLARDPQYSNLQQELMMAQYQLAQMSKDSKRGTRPMAQVERKIAALQQQLAQYRESVKRQVIESRVATSTELEVLADELESLQGQLKKMSATDGEKPSKEREHLEQRLRELMDTFYEKARKAGKASQGTLQNVPNNIDRPTVDTLELRTATITPEPAPELPQANRSSLRYDDKPFDEWRTIWRNELSTERRLEAAKVLAAFARVGYGKEAAEAILNVAGEYDFRTRIDSDSPEGKLRTQIVSSLTSGSGIDSTVTFQRIVDRYNAAPEKWQGLLAEFLLKAKQLDATTLDQLQKLRAHESGDIRAGAVAAIVAVDTASMPATVKAALADSDRQVVAQALQILDRRERLLKVNEKGSNIELVPFEFPTEEFVRLLLRTSPQRDRDGYWTAFDVINRLSAQTTSRLSDRLIQIVNDPSQSADHLAAIRAINVMGRKASATKPDIERILKDESADMRVRAAAATALDSFEGRFGQHGIQLLPTRPAPSDSDDEQVARQREEIKRLLNEEKNLILGR